MQVAIGLKLYFIHVSEGHEFSTSGISPKLFAGHVQVNLIDFDPRMECFYLNDHFSVHLSSA